MYSFKDRLGISLKSNLSFHHKIVQSMTRRFGDWLGGNKKSSANCAELFFDLLRLCVAIAL